MDLKQPTKQVEIYLTCNSWQRAQEIVDYLFYVQLITKAELMLNKDKPNSVTIILSSKEGHLRKLENELSSHNLRQKYLSKSHG